MDSTGWGEPMVGGILSQVMFGRPRGAGLAALGEFGLLSPVSLAPTGQSKPQ